MAPVCRTWRAGASFDRRRRVHSISFGGFIGACEYHCLCGCCFEVLGQRQLHCRVHGGLCVRILASAWPPPASCLFQQSFGGRACAVGHRRAQQGAGAIAGRSRAQRPGGPSPISLYRNLPMMPMRTALQAKLPLFAARHSRGFGGGRRRLAS